MRPIVLLFAVSLLHSYDVQGSDTVTVFVQNGKDLLLDVRAPVDIAERSEFRWKYNHTENIVRLFSDNSTETLDSYQGRVKISLENYSLLLKNVKHADSGHYSAGVVSSKDVSVGEYSVTVQDLVSPVHGKVSVSLSSNSCNLTVTCSTQDSHSIISTFRCDANNCSQDKGEERPKDTTSGTSLHVYLTNGSLVICNHSNQISSAEDIITINHHCDQNDVSTPQSTVVAVAVTISVAVIVLVLVVIFAIIFVPNLKKGKQQSVDLKNTVYETVQVNTVTQHLDQTPTDEASAPSDPSIYNLVESGNMILPDSLYAQVKRS